VQASLVCAIALAAGLSLAVAGGEHAGVGETAGAPFGDHAARDASAWVRSVGVNVHVSWPGAYPYADTTRVISAMNYLGLQNMRDYMNADTVGIYRRLAHEGFRFDLMYNEADSLPGYVRQVHDLEVEHPGAVISLEGPNEVNRTIGRAVLIQQELYARAKADPVLKDKPVYAASLSGVTKAEYAQLRIADSADAGNVHIYYGGGQPAYGWSPHVRQWAWDNWLRTGALVAPGKPVVITETGAPSSPQVGVDELTQAKQILNSLMDAARSGTPRIYLYELIDSHNDGPQDRESHFGLFRYDGSPKPAAEALRNFTTILTNGGPTAGRPGTLAYGIEGAPAWGGHLLFQEGDGTHDIVVWAEPDIWDEARHEPIVAPAAPITIRLAAPARVAIYDPLTGAAPLRVLETVTRVEVSLTDHPLVVEVLQAGKARRSGRP